MEKTAKKYRNSDDFGLRTNFIQKKSFLAQKSATSTTSIAIFGARATVMQIFFFFFSSPKSKWCNTSIVARCRFFFSR